MWMETSLATRSDQIKTIVSGEHEITRPKKKVIEY